MLEGGSSEDTVNKNSDGDSGHEAASNQTGYKAAGESSDGNGDDDDGRDSSDDTAMVPIPEATNLRGRNSGIIIREPTDSSNLVSASNKRKGDNDVRLPAKKIKGSIVASASSSAANNVSAALANDPVEISSQSLVNVHAETIATTSSDSWIIPAAIPVRQARIDAIAARSNLQGPIFGSSPRSINTRPSSVLLGSPSRSINRVLNSVLSGSSSWSINAVPEPVLLGSSSNANVEDQAQENITSLTSCSQPLPLPAIPLYQQHIHQPPSPSLVLWRPQGYFPIVAPHANATQRPLLQIPPDYPFNIPLISPFRNAVPGLYNRAQMNNINRWWWNLLPHPYSYLRGPYFAPGRGSIVPRWFQVHVTRPSSVNPHRQNSASSPIPSSVNPHRPNSASRPIPSTTMLGSSSSSRFPAQANAIRPPASGLLPAAMPSYQQQQLRPSSSSMGLPQHLRQQPPLLQDVRGLDLNLPANNEDADEEEDEGLDLNLPARDE